MHLPRPTRVLAALVVVLLALGLALVRCEPEPRTALRASAAVATSAPSSTSSSAPTTTTLPAPPPPTTTTLPAPPPTTVRPPSRSAVEPPSPVDDAFWARLGPGCESSTGRGGNGGGWFQFGPDTAAKVGYHAGLSYEEQRGLAKAWLARIGGPAHGGDRSGWPHCWWVAKAGG